MLKLAFLYKDKLNEVWQSVALNEKYKYYDYSSYNMTIYDNSRSVLQLVSVDGEDNILGFFSANINRDTNKASNIGAINFRETNITFSRDFYQFLTELFTKYGVRKIEWCVIMGNPAERLYNKIIAKYGGRVVGVRYQTTMTSDGILRDEKEYEIFKCDYDLHLNKFKEGR